MRTITGVIGSFFLDIIETVVVSLAIFVVIYLFLYQPHQVKGNSMESNFHDSEYILTDKISCRFNKPKRGEVIVFRAPPNPELDFIKRVIGLGGDRVKVENGKTYINGQLLNETYLDPGTITYGGSYLREGQDLTIPADHLFVMGDNRSHSSDSREWGTITDKDIIGKAFFRYWPPTRMGLIQTAKY